MEKTGEMKKMILIFLSAAMLQACNNSSETKSDTTNPSGVENVNGNVPDSNNSTNLNQGLPIDSSRVKDSLRR